MEETSEAKNTVEDTKNDAPNVPESKHVLSKPKLDNKIQKRPYLRITTLSDAQPTKKTQSTPGNIVSRQSSTKNKPSTRKHADMVSPQNNTNNTTKEEEKPKTEEKPKPERKQFVVKHVSEQPEKKTQFVSEQSENPTRQNEDNKEAPTDITVNQRAETFIEIQKEEQREPDIRSIDEMGILKRQMSKKPSTKKQLKEEVEEEKPPIEKPVSQEITKGTEQTQDKTSQRLTLVPYEGLEEEIIDFFSKHDQQIEVFMRQAFSSNITGIFQACNSGQDSRWLQIKQGSKPIGLVAANIKSANFTVRRLEILYFTVTQPDLYEEAVALLVDYIWRTDPCDDIWVGLCHTQLDGGKLGVNPKLEEAYKKNGFRWKRVTNDPLTEVRKTEYAVKRPEGVVSENK